MGAEMETAIYCNKVPPKSLFPLEDIMLATIRRKRKSQWQKIE